MPDSALERQLTEERRTVSKGSTPCGGSFSAGAIVLIVIASFFRVPSVVAEEVDPYPVVPPPLPPLPLRIEVEGVEIESPEIVRFYGSRVPRSHFYGVRSISERRFFEIAGDEESARRSRNHRIVNAGLSTLSILSFFSGLVLFGAADDVDFARIGLPGDTPGRVLSLSLIGGSIVPASVLMIRGNHWASLEFSYRTMQRFNEDR